jgi:hypothetical protein
MSLAGGWGRQEARISWLKGKRGELNKSFVVSTRDRQGSHESVRPSPRKRGDYVLGHGVDEIGYDVRGAPNLLVKKKGTIEIIIL